jgi:N-acetylglucosaminyldiphosphoundecaprenol N-acetyl-beta-D-mannosaminyltransferase
MSDLFPRFDVLGTAVSLSSYDHLFEALVPRLGRVTTTVAFCNVHSVMTARADEYLADAFERFDVTNPDGIPLVWALRRVHRLPAARVYGPTFMRVALERGQALGWRHFFLGSTEETLTRLTSEVNRRYPEAHIVGTYSPPFRELTQEDLDEITSAIDRTDADLVWVGMGMPKQELLIPRLAPALHGRALLGVGAAFDLLAGNQPEAPAWMQSRGLEWLFRLVHEPRRLWRRYLLNNPLFLVLLAGQIVRSRLRDLRFRESEERRQES